MEYDLSRQWISAEVKLAVDPALREPILSRPTEGQRGAFRVAAASRCPNDRRVTLLAQIQAKKEAQREELRLTVQAQLEEVLRRLLPGQVCWVYGSLVRRGGFREWSDVDLALEAEPIGRSICLLSTLLAEELGRPVDLVLLDETRLAEKIRREGERWTA
jgi:predicted nucleotidyltransferase